jgi:hypothetical protein
MTDQELHKINGSITYDPITGKLCRSTSAGNHVIPPSRYVVLAGKKISTARIAWYLGHHEWPTGAVIHINGDCTDYRLSNLAINRRIKAQIRVGDKIKHLGYFPTVEAKNEAIAQYRVMLSLGLINP